MRFFTPKKNTPKTYVEVSAEEHHLYMREYYRDEIQKLFPAFKASPLPKKEFIAKHQELEGKYNKWTELLEEMGCDTPLLFYEVRGMLVML